MAQCESQKWLLSVSEGVLDGWPVIGILIIRPVAEAELEDAGGEDGLGLSIGAKNEIGCKGVLGRRNRLIDENMRVVVLYMYQRRVVDEDGNVLRTGR